jgi:hypothetical protein
MANKSARGLCSNTASRVNLYPLEGQSIKVGVNDLIFLGSGERAEVLCGQSQE